MLQNKREAHFSILIIFFGFALSTCIFSQSINEIVIKQQQAPKKIVEKMELDGPVIRPNVVADSEGNCLLSWERGNYSNVIAAKLLSKNDQVLYEKILDNGSESIQPFRTYSNGNGLFVISWKINNDSTGSKLFVEVIDNNGNVILSDYELLSVSDYLTSYDIDISDLGLLAVTWSESDYNLNTTKIFTKFYDINSQNTRNLLVYSGEFSQYLNINTRYKFEDLTYLFKKERDVLFNYIVNDTLMFKEPQLLYNNEDGDVFNVALEIDSYNQFWITQINRIDYKYHGKLLRYSENFEQLTKSITLFEDYDFLVWSDLVFSEDSVYFSTSFSREEGYESNLFCADTNCEFYSRKIPFPFDEPQLFRMAYSDGELTLHHQSRPDYFELQSYFQRLKLNGEISEPIQTEKYTFYEYDPYLYKAVFGDNGQSVLIYDRSSYGESPVFFRFLDNQGNTIGDEKIICNESGEIKNLGFDAVFLDNETVLYCWTENLDGELNTSLKCRIMKNDFSFVSDTILVAKGKDNIFRTPQVQVISDSLVGIAFRSNDQLGKQNHYLGIINTLTKTLSKMHKTNTGFEYQASETMFYPKYSVNSLGDGVVMWSHLSGSKTDVYARYFDKQGFALDDTAKFFMSINGHRSMMLQAIKYNDDRSITITSIDKGREMTVRYMNQDGTGMAPAIKVQSWSDPFGTVYSDMLYTSTQDGNVSIHYKDHYDKVAKAYVVGRGGNLLYTENYVLSTENNEWPLRSFGKVIDDKIYSVQWVKYRDIYDPFIQYRVDRFTLDVTNVEEATPENFFLLTNYPNPFNPETTVQFNLPESGNVRLNVYNTLGELVSTLANGEMTAGQHNLTFNAAGMASGVYIARLDYDNGTKMQNKTIKMLVLK